MTDRSADGRGDASRTARRCATDSSSPTPRSSRTASRSRHDEGWGITLWRVRAPLVSAVVIDGLYPNDTWSGRDGHVHAAALRAGHAHGRCCPATRASSSSRRRSSRARTGAVVGRVRLPARRAQRMLRVPVRSDRRERRECRVVFTVDPTAVPAEVTGGANPDDRELGAHFNRFVYEPAPVRIAFDVSPLSHPLLGIGNYIQGSLAGLAEAAAGEHEIVAFAPTSLRGPKRIRAALAGIDVELRTWPLPVSHAVRTAWSRLGRPAAERLLGALRRAPLLGLDVPAAARRRPRDDDPRPRAASPSRVDDRADAFDARAASTENAARDVRRRLRELGVHGSRRRADASASRPSGFASRIPAPKAVYRAGRPGGRPRRAVRPHRRDARAAEEPAGARRGAAPARRRARARRRRRRGLGRAAAPRRSANPAARLRLGRGARAPLPWSGRGRVSLALRGLRDPDDRGDGVRCSRRRLVARVAGRGVRRRGGARRSRGSRRDRRRDRACTGRARASSSRAVSSTRRGSRGAPWARSSSAGTRRRGRERRPGDRRRRAARRPEFLVLRRAPERLGYWHLVAGGLEPDEAPTEAAQRELARGDGPRVDSAAAGDRALVLAPRRPSGDPGSLRARRRDGHRPRLRRGRAGGLGADARRGARPLRWCDLDEALELLDYDEPREGAVRAAARELQ